MTSHLEIYLVKCTLRKHQIKMQQNFYTAKSSN